MSCKVAYCRFSYTHTTKSHQCGICKGFGHGQTECNSSAKKDALRRYYSDELPPSLWCDYLYCNCRENHKTNSHCCKYCDQVFTTRNNLNYHTSKYHRANKQF